MANLLERLPKRWRPVVGYAGALASAVAAGLLYAVNKQVTRDVSPLQVTFVEAAVAALLLLPGYAMRFRKDPLPRGTPWVWLGLFGLTAVVLFYLRTLGISLTSPTTAALLTRVEIVIVLVYSYLFLTEKPTVIGWLGCLALVAGLVTALDLPAQGLVLRLTGVLAALGCGAGIAINSIIIKLKLGGVRSELIALANVWTQVLLYPLALLAAGELLNLGEVLRQPRLLVLLVVGGALIPGMLTTYYLSMKCIPMWSCRLLNLGTPVVAILAEYFWLRSAISASQLLGLLLVTTGAALVILWGTPTVQRSECGAEVG
ncbi:MAG: DMT family transporter [Armatimonadia bacterium]